MTNEISRYLQCFRTGESGPSFLSPVRQVLKYSALICLLVTGSLTTYAQSAAGGANADIVKMIQAGLPEGAILDKIQAGTGRWDTSVDALIVLKKAGATDAEIKALTVAPAPAVAAVPSQPVYVGGGILRRTKAGDPFIQFPERITTIFPNGDLSNRVMLVSYQGKPAIRIPTQFIWIPTVCGNLIVNHDAILFNPYLAEFYFGAYPKNGKYILQKDYVKNSERSAFSMPLGEVNLHYNDFKWDDRVTIFGKDKYKMYNPGWHLNQKDQYYKERDAQMRSPEMEQFLSNLIHDFDGTIAQILSAAGITDVDRQLSADAHFKLITYEEFPKYAAIYQAQLDRMPPPAKGEGGGFWNGLAAVTNIVAAGATAVQSSGSDVQTQVAARQQYDAAVAAALNGTPAQPSTTTASTATASTSSQSAADTSSGSSTTAKGHYTGVNAQYVNMMLSRSVNWSCSPYRAPAKPTKITCQRDGFVYQAQQTAVASECSAQAGHPEDAVTDANLTLSALKSAGQLCGAQAPTGPVRCDTDTLISCAQLPR
jgi:hypothetical protein